MKRKVAVFISSGLGDALLLVPLVKKLKQEGAEVTGIFTGAFRCENLFANSDLFHYIIVLKKNTISIGKNILKLYKKYDVVYLNFFAASKSNFLIAAFLSKQIITNKIPQGLPEIIFKKIKFIEPVKNIHDATQNLRLLNPQEKDTFLSEESFALDFNPREIDRKKFSDISQGLNQRCFSVQISSGNNIDKYKNWTINNWVGFLKLMSKQYPQHYFILIGEKRETEISNQILKEKITGVYSTVGKTNLQEAIALIAKSQLFIGLDGGLMHIAVCAGKPTFTIWGPSDFNLYGYEKINPEKHKIIFSDVYCRPCNSWINPNKTRVNHPSECPDFMCMKNISPEKAFDEFQLFCKQFSFC